MNKKQCILLIIVIIILVIIWFSVKTKKKETYELNSELGVYEFKLGYGGIGDFIKFMQASIKDCENKKIKNFKIDLDHPINKYLIIKDKYKWDNKIKSKKKIFKPFKYYNLLKKEQHNKSGDFSPLNYFSFSDDLIENEKKMKRKYKIPDDYISIHLRMGDKYMSSTNRNKNDKRTKNIKKIEEKIEKIINTNNDKEILFFSDNEDIKNKYNNKYNNIKIIPIDIIHTSECYKNTDKRDKLLKDNLTEFLILSKSKNIYSLSKSGYPMVASWIYDKKLIKYN